MGADKSPFFEELIKGKPTHRLCIDFNHVEGIREFTGKAQAAGLLPDGCEPIVIFSGDEPGKPGHGSTVWLVGKRKERLIVEVN